MPSPKNRTRHLIFRLTNDEYDALQKECTDRGGRNLSEYARSQLLSSPRSRVLNGMIETRLIRLEQLLSDLYDSVGRLLDGAPGERTTGQHHNGQN